MRITRQVWAPADAPGGVAVIVGDPAVAIPENWKEALSPDLRDDKSMATITNVPDLVKSFVAAQHMVGADKLAIPGENATETEWAAVYEKLGRPEKADGYKVDLPEELPDGFKVDDRLVGAYKDAAHAAGLNPQQAQAVATWFLQTQAQAFSDMGASRQTEFDATTADLQKEWGLEYKNRLRKANAVIRDYGGDELVQFLQSHGLDNNAIIAKTFAAIGMRMGSEYASKEGQGRGMGKTPAEAQQELGELQINKEHRDAKYDFNHPGHKAAIERERLLYAMINPETAEPAPVGMVRG